MRKYFRQEIFGKSFKGLVDHYSQNRFRSDDTLFGKNVKKEQKNYHKKKYCILV